jgi:hypothetical protein
MHPRQLPPLTVGGLAIDKLQARLVCVREIGEYKPDEHYASVRVDYLMDLSVGGWPVMEGEYTTEDMYLEAVPFLPDGEGTFGKDLRVKCLWCGEIQQEGWIGEKDAPIHVICEDCGGS